MMDGYSAWSLPGLADWVGQVAFQLENGIALVSADTATPEALEKAITDKAPRLISKDLDCPEDTPGDALRAAFGTTGRLDDLLSKTLDEECAVIRFKDIPTRLHTEWALFLKRFSKQRAGKDHGIHILVPDLPLEVDVPAAEVIVSWQTALRRGDRVIWAEEHLPNSRGGAADELAVALATEVCRWRLDLAASLAQAGLDDLCDPINWLKCCNKDPDPGRINDNFNGDHCPLALLRDEKISVVAARVWRAQLISLFPLIEEERQKLIDRHRKMLRVDEHTRSLGVESVEELELGALKWQLIRRVDRTEADRLIALAKIRNALAHRKPGSPEDVRLLIDRRSSTVR